MSVVVLRQSFCTLFSQCLPSSYKWPAVTQRMVLRLQPNKNPPRLKSLRRWHVNENIPSEHSNSSFFAEVGGEEQKAALLEGTFDVICYNELLLNTSHTLRGDKAQKSFEYLLHLKWTLCRRRQAEGNAQAPQNRLEQNRANSVQEEWTHRSGTST